MIVSREQSFEDYRNSASRFGKNQDFACQEQLPPPNLRQTNKLTPLQVFCTCPCESMFFCVCVFLMSEDRLSQYPVLQWTGLRSGKMKTDAETVSGSLSEREAAVWTAFGNVINYFLMQVRINKCVSFVPEEIIQPAGWKLESVRPGFVLTPP